MCVCVSMCVCARARMHLSFVTAHCLGYKVPYEITRAFTSFQPYPWPVRIFFLSSDTFWNMFYSDFNGNESEIPEQKKNWLRISVALYFLSNAGSISSVCSPVA